MKKDIFCAGVSFTGRSYTALRTLERAYPEMGRSELIGRSLLLAVETAAANPDLFCARAYNPKGGGVTHG